MIIRELLTKWGFEVHDKPLDEINEKLEHIKHRLEFLAAAEVVKGIYELTERFAHFAEQLHLTAMSAGITVESLQRLSFAAEQNGVSTDQLSGAMMRLSRILYDARRGGAESQKVFAQAGFSQQQLMGFKTSADALAALADKLHGMKDPIQKQALAMSLLGRGAGNMVGYLSKGSAAIRGMGEEAEKLGIVLSEEQIEKLTEVENSFQKLGGVIRGVAATVAAYFAPSVKLAIEEFIKFYSINRKLIDTNIREWVWDITYALGFVWEAVKTVTQAFFNFAASHQLLVRRVTEILVALGVFVGLVWAAQRAVGFLSAALNILGGTLGFVKSVARIALTPLVWVAGLAQKAIVALILRLAILAEGVLPALSEALIGFGAILEATPVGWFITAIAALIVVLHDAWKLLTGGSFKDTWIGQAFNAVKGFGSKALEFFGLGSGQGEGSADSAAQRGAAGFGALNAAQASGGGTFANFPLGGPPGQNMNYQVNAPINITVPPGADHKMVGERVQAGVADHLDRVYRETQRSLRPAQAY